MKRRIGIWFLVGLMASGLGIWIAVVARPGPVLGRVLPDGTVVTLARVTYAKELRLTVGSGWKKVVGRLLPDRVSRKFGIKTVIQSVAGSNTLFFVLETQRSNTFSAFPRAMPFTFGTSITLSDDVGNHFVIPPPMQFKQSTNTLTEVFAVPIVSHLATQLTARVEQQDYAPPSKQLVEFTFPNPAPHRMARWNPGPLPATNHLGDLTVVLSAFAWASPRVQVYKNGVRADEWVASIYSVEDEDGNVLRLNSSAGTRLSSLEPRKFRFELRRTFPSGPKDLLSLTNIAMDHAASGLSPLIATFRSHRIKISTLNRGQVTYEIEPPLQDEVHDFEFWFVDEEGQRQTVWKHPVAGSGLNIGFGPGVPTNIDSVNLTFTFRSFTNRYVDFIARPDGNEAGAVEWKGRQ